MSYKQNIKGPALYNYNNDLSKEWYVGFRITNQETGVRKPFQIRLGINHAKTIKERTAEGKELVNIVRDALNQEWNPFAMPIEQFLATGSAPIVEATNSNTTLAVALQLAYNSKLPYWEPKTQSIARGIIKTTIQAAVELNINHMPISEYSRKQVKMLLDRIAIIKNAGYEKEGKGKIFTGNNYNKHRLFLSMLFSEIEELELINHNPVTRIKNKQEIRTNKHRHATADEKRIILRRLADANPKFQFFLAIEHDTGIRPKEILGLKISDLDMFNQCFVIEATGNNKTGITRRVPIPNRTYELLKHHISGYSKNHYIFSNNFKPGLEHKRSDYATKTWHRLIITGLKLNVSMYSFKGLGGEAKRKAGVSFEAISAQYGHSSGNMTQIYLHGEADRINKEIIHKSPTLM